MLRIIFHTEPQAFVRTDQIWRLWPSFGRPQIRKTYFIDSFPIPVRDDIRIARAKIYQDEAFRGYIASKKRYFYGLKVYLMITGRGEPVEFLLTPGAMTDVKSLRMFNLNLPEGTTIHRKVIETTSSLLEELLSKHIHQ